MWFTLKLKTYKQLQVLLNAGAVKNGFCVHNPVNGFYWLAFDYYDPDLMQWYKTYLSYNDVPGKEHGSGCAKRFKSFQHCRMYASGLGFALDSFVLYHDMGTDTPPPFPPDGVSLADFKMQLIKKDVL